MKFTVITVCYNSEKTIRRTFESVLNQSFTDFEYIVVDGDSKDKTVDIIKEYVPKFSGRMRYVSEPDKGIYDAMNKGIRLAQGDIIGIVNSDDWFEKDALAKVAEKAGEDYDFYYGMVRNVSGDGKEIDVVRRSHNYIKSCGLHHPGCFIAKAAYEKYGVYTLDYKVSSDYELMMRFAQNNVRFCPVDAILSNFTIGGISSRTPAYEIYAIRRQYNVTSRIGYIAEVAVEFFLKKILKR